MSNKKYHTSPHQTKREEGGAVVFANDDGIVPETGEEWTAQELSEAEARRMLTRAARFLEGVIDSIARATVRCRSGIGVDPSGSSNPTNARLDAILSCADRFVGSPSQARSSSTPGRRAAYSVGTRWRRNACCSALCSISPIYQCHASRQTADNSIPPEQIRGGLC